MIVNYPRMRRRATWPDDLNTALEFSSANPFSISAPKSWDNKLEYTNGSGWKTWDGSKINSGTTESKNVIYIRGVGNTKVTGLSGGWTITGQEISCNGNIERLLNWEDVESGKHPKMASYCYRSMFYGCTSLTAAPSLPATTLEMRCYTAMFYGCTKIKLSTAASGTYTKSYRIPKSGTGTTASGALDNMFANTGGTFKGTPTINTTYYLDKSNTIV